jgi:hypothetical protein
VKDSTLLEKLPQSDYAICRIFQDCKKIRSFSNIDYSNLAFVLLKKCAELGMEKPPLAMEVVNWTVFIGKNYKSLALEDIDKAIELSLKGQLATMRNDQYIPVSVKDWNWKPLITLCEVLNAYVDYQRDKMKIFNRELSKKLDLLEAERQRDVNFISYVNEWKTNVLNAWNIFNDTGLFELKDPYISYFGKLFRSGLISIPQTKIDEIKEIAVMCVDPEEVKRKTKDIYGIRETLKISKDQEEYLIRQKCAELCIEEQFLIWKKENQNVKEIIESLKFNLEE